MGDAVVSVVGMNRYETEVRDKSNRNRFDDGESEEVRASARCRHRRLTGWELCKKRPNSRSREIVMGECSRTDR